MFAQPAIKSEVMKLLTHNMLACHIRGVKNNFPFLIEAIKVEQIDADYNPGRSCMHACMVTDRRLTTLACPMQTS